MLKEIESFSNEEFDETRTTVDRLIQAGKLKSLGLDPTERTWLVEMYEDDQGRTWLFAQVDQAFRGYLRIRKS